MMLQIFLKSIITRSIQVIFVLRWLIKVILISFNEEIMRTTELLYSNGVTYSGYLFDPNTKLICHKQLPNGDLEIDKEYTISSIYKCQTEFGEYYIYTIDRSHFSSAKYDPYYIKNYFLTIAEFRDKRMSEVLN